MFIILIPFGAIFPILQFSLVQLLTRVWLFATPWIAHARPPCPSPSPGVHSDSRPSSPWCHPAISSSVALFSCFQSFPAPGSFSVSQLFASGGQSIGASALASMLLMNIQCWFLLRFDLLDVQGTLKSLLQYHNLKASVPRCLAFLYGPTLTWLLEKL